MKHTKWLYFLYLCVVYLIINSATLYLLDVEALQIEYLLESLTNEQVNKMLAMKEKWAWLSYLFMPIFLFLKIISIAGVLFIGVFFLDRKANAEPLSFWQLFHTVTIAEFIFLLVPIGKLIYFLFIQTNFTFEELQTFYPLSMINIIGTKGLEKWLLYPLQILNIFELFYLAVLSYSLGKLLAIKAEKALHLILSTYGIGLVIWVVLIMFLTLNYS